MQIYESLGACAMIAAASGMFRCGMRRLGIRPFDLAYAGLILLTLGRFSISPAVEFCCNAAAFSLPMYFLVQMVGQQDKTMPSAAWKMLFAAAMLPVLWTLAAALVELWQLNYASVNLSGTALLNAQAILSATVFCGILLHSGIQTRRTA